MLRVLVVEDEEMIRKGIVLATDWQSLGCVVVGEASNGEEGIEKAEVCKPSLIITDLKMPKMDGLEMIAKLRERGCEAYVIILTAYDSFTYAQTAIRLGAVDFLLKPFHDGDLENAVLALQKKIEGQKKSRRCAVAGTPLGREEPVRAGGDGLHREKLRGRRAFHRAGRGGTGPERGAFEPSF